ncbi:MAG: YXWGXW repeat-containing protein [Pirellulales bacterium]
MKSQYLRAFLALGACGLLGWTQGQIAAAQAPGDAADAAGDVQIMNRGPVHEAFAEPVTGRSVAGLAVPKKPPQAIEEMPPDIRPQGDNVVWIPGYWGWEQDRQDFVWISGVWRVPPPGQQWVPGYWTAQGNGYQWVSGFWTAAQSEQVQYLPAPPASLELGATSVAPTPDYFWVPGCWRWYRERYVWQPGYWSPLYADWVWVPAQYVWTPRGWIFLAGRWDLPLARRGMLFAPVYFRRPIYLRSDYYYSPSVVLDPGGLLLHLFACPRYHHYFFGDYYAAGYEQMGIYPWFNVAYAGRYVYDPLWSYYRGYFRTRDPRWAGRTRQWFQNYRNDPASRPAHTYAVQQVRLDKMRELKEFKDLIGVSLGDLARRPNAATQFGSVSETQRRTIERSLNDFQKFQTNRFQIETKTGALGAARLGSPGTADVLKRSEWVRLPKLPAQGLLKAEPFQTPSQIGLKPTLPGSTLVPKSQTDLPRTIRAFTPPGKLPGTTLVPDSLRTEPTFQPKTELNRSGTGKPGGTGGSPLPRSGSMRLR